MVLIVQTTILSDGKRGQLLAYYKSMAHSAVATLTRISNETAAELGLQQMDIGLEATSSPAVVVSSAYDWCADWWIMLGLDRRRQIAIVAVLALGLEVGRFQYQAHLRDSDTYKSNFINSCGRAYYIMCWRLMLIWVVAVQIKCYVNLTDYALKLAVAVCLVAIYRKLRSVISVFLTLSIVATSCRYGFGQLVSAKVTQNVHYGMHGSEVSRPLLIMMHVILGSISSLLASVFHQLREEAATALLHISFISAPEILEFCWWQLTPAIVLSAHAPSTQRLDTPAALCAKLCQRLGHYSLVFTALLWLDWDRNEFEPNKVPRPVWGDITDNVYQQIALAILVALSVRLVERLLAAIAQFIAATVSARRNIVDSASAIAFVVATAKSVHIIRAVLDEALAPLPSGEPIS
jgi:hypothetical protein